jgi:hypothetical protein
MMFDGIAIPHHAVARAVRDNRVTIDDRQRLP